MKALDEHDSIPAQNFSNAQSIAQAARMWTMWEVACGSLGRLLSFYVLVRMVSIPTPPYIREGQYLWIGRCSQETSSAQITWTWGWCSVIWPVRAGVAWSRTWTCSPSWWWEISRHRWRRGSSWSFSAPHESGFSHSFETFDTTVLMLPAVHRK